MVFVLVVLLAAVALGWAAGGRLDRLGSMALRARWLVPVALVAQLVGALVGGAAYAVGLAVSALGVGVFLARNRGVRGTGLIALGLLGNAVVVGLNGAMPVSDAALGRAGVSTQDIDSGADPRHEIAGPGTRLRIVGDVVPVALPGRPEVVSPGDLLVAAGLAQLVVVGMRRRVAPLTERLSSSHPTEDPMAKKGRKRRGRKKSAANHGKRPNA